MSLEIMHIDMDAFFAAVEQLDKPELRGKPVIVGGVNLSDRGVVSTASYEAREFGVHSAMPIVEAKRLCPDGIFLPGRHQRYQELSYQVFSICRKYTPLVEKVSIDEAFLDLKGCHRLYGSSQEIGNKIKNEILEKLKLVASVGLAPNKFLAKMASDLEKPNGFCVIPEEEIIQILKPLPVDKIWGVGSKTELVLHDKGIRTIGDLQQVSLNGLISIFGKKMGEHLYQLARGIDHRSVEPENQVKSISHEETFIDDLTDQYSIYASLMEMSGKVTRRLRQKGFKGNTVFIKVRYGDFTTCTRRITLSSAISSPDELYQAGKRLLVNNKLLTKPVRLLGIGVDNLITNEKTQLSLFVDRIKDDKLTKVVDDIKDRFGDKSVIRARNLTKKTKREDSL